MALAEAPANLTIPDLHRLLRQGGWSSLVSSRTQALSSETGTDPPQTAPPPPHTNSPNRKRMASFARPEETLPKDRLLHPRRCLQRDYFKCQLPHLVGENRKAENAVRSRHGSSLELKSTAIHGGLFVLLFLNL